MERGEREPKRMRPDYSMHSPAPYESRYGPPERSLPPPRLGPPGPPPPGEPIRRHSSQYEDHSRAYNGYEPRDIPMKQDPSFDPRPQPEMMRPNSTGHHPMHHPRPDDRRPYDHPSVTNGSLPVTSQFMPPPLPQYSDRTTYYDAPTTETPRESVGFGPIEIGYSATSSTSQKKRSARTTQACEACRHAKAKCTDPKPCQGCVEKGIDCKYDPPPPKQSDKVTSEVTTQLESLRESFETETKRRREKDRQDLERQKRQQRQLDMILKALTKGAPETGIEIDSENCIRKMKSEEDETSASVQPSIEGGDDSEEIDDQLNRDASIRQTVHRPRSERPASPVDTTYFKELALDIDTGAPKQYYGGEDTYGDVGIPDTRGHEDVIPLRHTTSSHYVLQWPSVMQIWQGASVKPESVEKFDPYAIEMARGIVHLHGTGQGYEQVSLDVNYLRETSRSLSGSDNSSDSAPSPIAEKSWGFIGSSPDPEPLLLNNRWNPHGLKPDRTPPFDEKTVKYLANVYMETLNIMHPIITRYGLEQLIKLFLKEIAATTKNHAEGKKVAGYAGHSAKRKRDSPSEGTTVAPVDDNRLPYTMSTATMLLILALGKICDYKKPIPAPPAAPDAPLAESPPSITWSQSPSPGQRPAKLPHHKSARPPQSPGLPLHSSSAEPKYPHDVKNVDVIPGLAYFALAANILGDHEGEYTPQMVQACLLAGLYHGQLGRPLQSYSYIYRAGVCMQWALPESKREYFRQKKRADPVNYKQGTAEYEANRRRKRKENHILFSFWTCLQLERSDIVAELDCPRSGILNMEEVMPWPHMDVALEAGDITPKEHLAYMTQLSYRNHLNMMHRDLYSPTRTSDFSPTKLRQPAYVQSKLEPVIDTYMQSLDTYAALAQLVSWKDDDPPATDILDARLRGKYYGAQNITYRHFLRAVLDSGDQANFPPKLVEYARRCVYAMKHSCEAFTRCTKPGERLIVTNSWGTAHAQWGNTVVLHAVFNNKLLRECITEQELISITANVRNFLCDIAQHGSAIEMDLRFLDAVSRKTGILDEVLGRRNRTELATSFSSNGDGGLILTPTV